MQITSIIGFVEPPTVSDYLLKMPWKLVLLTFRHTSIPKIGLPDSQVRSMDYIHDRNAMDKIKLKLVDQHKLNKT